MVNGVAHTALRVTEHLVRRGHRPLVVAPAAPPQYGRAKDEVCPVVRIPAVSWPGYPSVRLVLPSREVSMAITAHRPDVVHLSSPVLLGARAMTAARRRDLPTLAVYETDMAAYSNAYLRGLPGGPTVAWRRLRSVHAAADRTLALSTASKLSLEAQGIPRVHICPHGVDSVRFHPGHRDEELRRMLAPNGEVLVGYVGRLAPEKHVQLLRATCDLPGVRVVVVGDGPTGRQLRNALPSAVFLGRRTGADLASIYASLDVFAHTGPFETFGLTVQEAMASGLPVVAPAAGGPLDLVDHGRTGYLVPPLDQYAVRDAVRTLVASPDLRASFGKAARATAVTRTWEAAGDVILDHYAEILKTRGVSQKTRKARVKTQALGY
ncbi:glycosyltransferase family 4 protein [Kribbella italica]|uniref:Phosphatidylinositol alpha 1,6-mannosyltransferase n=1 Tax=Kribbella italica TaxID=1540520 RepID=A0A7W9J743_9ACTN|nr:glycosyltransferase family 1 protein [Kribbella italica]MBB5836846.1 phosphatidylinositol alpha 1,6-mannosyltransferase [Kribbella italica]